MFEQLIMCQYPEKLKIDAIPYIEVDRKKNSIIYDTILKYAEKNKILISEISLLLDKHRYWDEINMFTTNAEHSANILTKQLCETFGNCFTLKILNNDTKYNIEYNLKLVCTITSFKVHEKYSLSEFVQPVTKQLNGINILLVSPLLEIINLYKILYNPLQYENWKSTLKKIQSLEILLNTNISQLLVVTKKQISELYTDEPINKLKDLREPILKFFSDSNYLLLQHTIGEVLTVISKNTVDHDLNTLTNYLKEFNTLGIVYKERIMYLPNEFSMKKTMFYTISNDGKIIKRKNILIIFNNLTYELINYVPLVLHGNNFNIVDPITELRFLYLEIWEILISQKLEKLKYKQLITKKFKQLEKYKNLINISEYKKNYCGIYLDAVVQKKLYALTQPQKKYTFYCYEVI